MANFRWEQASTSHYFGVYWVPFASLSCLGPDGRARSVSFVVDTGAVHSIVKYSVGQVLGLPFEKGLPFAIRGIGGAVVDARVHRISIELDGRVLSVPFAVAEHNLVPNLLGRYGVIDRISILFNHRKKSTTLAWRL